MARVLNYSLFVAIVLIFFNVVHSKYVKNVHNNLNKRSPVNKAYPGSSNYVLVEPLVYHDRQRRAIGNTTQNLINNQDHLKIVLPMDSDELFLDLRINKHLISDQYFLKTQENGTDKVVPRSVEDVKFCHYQGKVRNKPESWVALSACDGLSGVIHDGSEMFYIEKKTGDDKVHFMYKQKDLINNNSCDDHEIGKHTPTRTKRETKELKIRGPYNSNNESRYVELILVVAHFKYLELEGKLEKVEQYCKDIVNIMNSLYSSLNIFIALVGVVVWTERDEVSLDENTLSNFLKYRKNKLNVDHPNDHAQLLTIENFEDGVIGKALKGPICTFEYSGSVIIANFPLTIVATSAAHLLGHNLGMEHDTDDCQCPEETCIMTKKANSPPTHWSSCSKTQLKNAFHRGMDHCLKNKPQSLFKKPVCGNSFVEEGEECDCGLPEDCKNKCCDAETCRLKGGAQCATGKCCNLETCSFKKSGLLCRQVASECDLPEYCTGNGEYCPEDVFKKDAEKCFNGEGYCYGGQCGTYNSQCRLLWGNGNNSSGDHCYKLNTKGYRFGHCGYTIHNNSFVKCNEEDIWCGLLQCQKSSSPLIYGLETTAIISHSFVKHQDTIFACRTATVDLGLQSIDPGMVPNGAKCGEDKMCVNQRCVSVTELGQNSTSVQL